MSDLLQSWHDHEINEILETLNSTQIGLVEEEAERRLREFGLNRLEEKKKKSALGIFLGQFKDVFVLMLLAAIVISLVTALMKHDAMAALEEFAEAITIGVIVALNAIIGFIQEYRSEEAMEALRKIATPKARVLRNRKLATIPAEEVVPGDVILLESGFLVPSDGRLLEVIDLRVDEAVLTGESVPVDKRTGLAKKDAPIGDQRNMVFMGTHVVYGRGKAIVTATGMNTEFGKIAGMMQEAEEEETPLKIKLDRFAEKLGMLVAILCVVIILVQAMSGIDWIQSFMTAIALAVSAVPEGLPAIVTVALALGARELAKRKAIIRKLSSAETLGSTTVICSDKTGTLTKGEMTVRRVYCAGQSIEVAGSGYEPKGEYVLKSNPIAPQNDEHLSLLLRIGALCNNSQLESDGNRWYVTGSSTEAALLVAARKAGFRKEDLDRRYARIAEIPFSSERKIMTTVHSIQNDSLHAYVKGAPEIILNLCIEVLENGEEVQFTEQRKKQALSVYEEYASNALRVLGMAYRSLPESTEHFTEEIEKDLVFVGFMGMIDPPREEVKEAVAVCRKAGIKPVMITGDHKLTAVAIAKEIGIFEDSGSVLTGEELNTMTDEELESTIENISVIARVSPEHKLRVVKALKRKGHIVAMTGDGVNDAPALKTADIGVAMGIAGTDVTREASDMVLADDNFATIVSSVEGGRIIYENIRKFIRFLLACNFAELVFIASFALAGLPMPLLPTMILWINLVTDGGPATALSMDPPAKDVMNRPPRDPKHGVLHGMVGFVIASTLLNLAGEVFVFSWVFFVAGESLEKARTMTFMFVALFELFVVWNCRSERYNAFKIGFHTNKFLMIAVVTSFLLTASLCYFPILQLMFHTVALSINDWLLVLATASLGLIVLPEIFMKER